MRAASKPDATFFDLPQSLTFVHRQTIPGQSSAGRQVARQPVIGRPSFPPLFIIWYILALSTPKDNDFAERRTAALTAKQALLEKFKTKPDENDPAVQAKIAERKARAEAKEARAEAKRREVARKKEEEAARLAAIEAEKVAEEAARRAVANERVNRVVADEAERKAARDARYAARKQRKK